MITKFKIFENINKGKPKVGDYVICKVADTLESTSFGIYVSTHVGKIDNIVKTKYDDFYQVEYSNTGNKFQEYQILYWSKNKEELEAILASKKYNI